MKNRIIRDVLIFILLAIYAVLLSTKLYFVGLVEAFCVGICIGLVSRKLANWITKDWKVLMAL